MIKMSWVFPGEFRPFLEGVYESMAKAGFEHQTQKTIIQVEFKGHGRCFVDVGRRVAKMC